MTVVAEKRRRARIEREWRTLDRMVRLSCRKRHGARGGPCSACAELLDYARGRLDRCPLRADKPTCAQCPVHCYRPDMRARIKDVMRFSGPRMIARHPVLSVLHLLDARRSRKALR